MADNDSTASLIVLTSYARMEASVVQIAQQGWAVPLFLTPTDLVELVIDLSPDAVDAAFVALFDAPDSPHGFDATAARLTKSDLLTPWSPLLRQVVTAYRRGDFLIAIPALLAVLEGVVAIGAGRETDVKKLVRKRLAMERSSAPDSIPPLLWLSVDTLVAELFRHSDFSAGPPAVMNRHWILHGRDVASWGRADSLRLLLAIDTLSVLMDERAV